VTLKHDTSSVFVFRRLAGGWRIGLIRHPRLHRMMIPGGHVEPEESCAEAALREVAEETGLAVMLVGPPAAPVPRGYRGRRVALPWWIAEYQVAADNHLRAAHVHVDHLYVALADGPEPRSGVPAGAPPPAAAPGTPPLAVAPAVLSPAVAPAVLSPAVAPAVPPLAVAPGASAAAAALVPNPAPGPAPGAADVPGAAEHPFAWYAAEELAALDMFDDARVLAQSLLAGLADGADRAGPAAALVAGLSRA